MYLQLAFRNVKKSFKDFSVYFITLLFGVCIFYAFNSITAQANAMDMNDMQKVMLSLLGFAMKGLSAFVAVILGFLVIYANRYLIRRRKREFAIYITLGMDRSKVSLIIVFETLFVGCLALVCGIILGIAISQLMLFITAGMFKVTVTGFNFVFSLDACISTIIYFAVIFLITLLFNVITVSRYKLINLIQAERKNERFRLKNPLLIVILFIVSIGCIAFCYYSALQENGFASFNQDKLTLLAILLVVGTTLFFFTSGSFLLQALQSNKKLYYRGVNMFIVRQISSKINTTFVSISTVCLSIFLAITFTCSGLAVTSSLNTALEDSTHYDVSVSFESGGVLGELGMLDKASLEQAKAANYDILDTIETKAPNAAKLISSSAQIYYYDGLFTYADLTKNASESIKKEFEGSGSVSVPIVKVSDLNKLRKLNGEPEINLSSNECMIWADEKNSKESIKKLIADTKTIELGDQTFKIAGDGLVQDSAQTSIASTNTGTLIVADDSVPEIAVFSKVILNANLKGSNKVDSMHEFSEQIVYAFGENSDWPAQSCISAQDAKDQSTGFAAIIAYLAIYIGLVLLIACAAILALQQMTEALDSAARYNMLAKIGADKHMLSMALFRQVATYFFYPLVLGLAHSCVGFLAAKTIFDAFGATDIVPALITTVIMVIIIYIVYFVLTYFAARTIIFTRQKRQLSGN